MKPNKRHGRIYAHSGQESINLYEIFPKSVNKRRNIKVKFMRYGIIHVEFFGAPILKLNPKLELLEINVETPEHILIVEHILKSIINGIILKFDSNGDFWINSKLTSSNYSKVSFNYKDIQIATEVIESNLYVLYTTYTIKV